MIATRDSIQDPTRVRPPARTPPCDQRPAAAAGEAGGAEGAPSPEGTVWDHPRAATLLPAELLQGGETIVLLLKPSAWWILLRSFRALTAMAVCFALLIWMRMNSYFTVVARRDLMILCFGLVTVFLFWQFLDWLSRVYVLTDRRVIRVKGVVRVQVFEAALRRIQHTDTTFSLPERLLGLGTVSFSTAGTGGVEASWQAIANPLEVHQIVVQTLSRYR